MKDSIVDLLKNIHEAKEAMGVNDLLGLKSADEYRELSEALEALVEEHIVFKTKKGKYILLKNCPALKIGRLAVNKKGFGFLVLDKEDDLYINDDNFNGAIDDDIVLCEVYTSGVRREARVLKVIKRDLNNLVGEVYYEGGEPYLKLDDSNKTISVKLVGDKVKDIVEGHKVLVKVVKQSNNKNYLAEIVRIIGHKNDPGTDILSIAYKHGIYEDFGEDVEKELTDIPSEVDPKELKGRKDLTGLTIFTIDGADTKDIDDAISLQMLKNGNYELGVHIADVSHYVKENTALGDTAYERGTSSYLADTVIPMIPHKLSNGICSLNEGTIRLTMSCVMEIDHKGKVINYDIFPSYIKSRKKMVYSAVNDIIVRDKVALDYEPYVDILKKMNELHLILRKEKISRGYIDFDIDEAKVIQDENGKAVDIKKRVREEGEMLIEDFMIAANETVANHIYQMDLPFIYRVHEDPKPEKIEEFMNLVRILGYKLEGVSSGFSPRTMQRILDQLREKKEFEVLSTLLLRSMRKAEYSRDNVGHFGLSSKAYTHFTSPIRRLADLLVHQMVDLILDEPDKITPEYLNEVEEKLRRLCIRASEKGIQACDRFRRSLSSA